VQAPRPAAVRLLPSSPVLLSQLGHVRFGVRLAAPSAKPDNPTAPAAQRGTSAVVIGNFTQQLAKVQLEPPAGLLAALGPSGSPVASPPPSGRAAAVAAAGTGGGGGGSSAAAQWKVVVGSRSTPQPLDLAHDSVVVEAGDGSAGNRGLQVQANEPFMVRQGGQLAVAAMGAVSSCASKYSGCYVYPMYCHVCMWLCIAFQSAVW
jgi:hypothetical protein